MRSKEGVAYLLLLAVFGCDPCAGSLQCNVHAQVSYTGQFVERVSGDAVPGVHVTFTRDSGLVLRYDTISATSDGDGFFHFESDSYQDGIVIGTLRIQPPAPFTEYTVPEVQLQSNRRRGGGGVFGRLVVNPSMQLVVEVLYAEGLAPAVGGSARIRQVGPKLLAPDSADFLISDNGRFLWEPTLKGFGSVLLELDINVPGDKWPYRFKKRVPIPYIDKGPRILGVQLRRPWVFYVGEVVRRGNGERRGGHIISWVQTSGPALSPSSIIGPTDENGRFSLRMETADTGTAYGTFTLTPPSPIAAEVRPNMPLVVLFDDTIQTLGILGYGNSVYFKLPLVYRSTGLPVPEGIRAQVQRVSGLNRILPPGVPESADSGIRAIERNGLLPYTAATADTGDMVVDVHVRLLAPHAWETIPGLHARARASDAPDTFAVTRVGLWFPWQGEVRDDVTNLPVSGASITFTRTGGGATASATFSSTSAADGKFGIHPVPLSTSAVQGTLKVQTAGAYRDTTLSISITTSQDDIALTLPTIRLKRP